MSQQAQPTTPQDEDLRNIPGVKRKRVSDEMHAVESFTLSLDAPNEDLAAFLGSVQHKTFDEFVVALRARVNADLTAGGWPPGDRRVLVSDKTWQLFTEFADLSGRIEIATGSSYVLARCAPFSKDWFLAKTSDALRDLEQLVGDDRAWAIFNLGRVLEAREHRVFEKNVGKAKKQSKDASLGGQIKANHNADETEAIVAEMDRLIADDHSRSGAGTLCANNGLGRNGSANVRRYNRHMERVKNTTS